MRILKLEVTQVAEELTMVSLRHGNAHNAIAKVCEALESLCLKIISTSITAVASGIVHNMFVECLVDSISHAHSSPKMRDRCPNTYDVLFHTRARVSSMISIIKGCTNGNPNIAQAIKEIDSLRDLNLRRSPPMPMSPEEYEVLRIGILLIFH
ncbi:hypothetical protein TRIUR3_16895 [Triticum urartu]|uniref:Plant bHLH transcription factor ACT-like domain-containing protein n=1 Tax=Triticum urartu TaxID=4572 RepID=M7YH16_TRIUA|nr:hypothetical protein TRIUR3_16895 [Triticum urartu]